LDLIQARFPDAAEADVQAAVALVQEIATEWVKKRDSTDETMP
jgi:hypothetical protein